MIRSFPMALGLSALLAASVVPTASASVPASSSLLSCSDATIRQANPAKVARVKNIRVGQLHTGHQLTCRNAKKAAHYLTFVGTGSTWPRGDSELFTASQKSRVGNVVRRSYQFHQTPDGPSPTVMSFTVRKKI